MNQTKGFSSIGAIFIMLGIVAVIVAAYFIGKRSDTEIPVPDSASIASQASSDVSKTSPQASASSKSAAVSARTAGCLPGVSPSIQITEPLGGEVFSVGQKVKIAWTSCNAADVYLSLNAGDKADLATVSAEAVPASAGSFVWTVPSFAALRNGVVAGYWIGASSQEDGGGALARSGNFTITDSSDLSCASNGSSWIKIVSPNGGETYHDGQQITVRWQSCNVPSSDLVNINLMRSDSFGGFIHAATTPDSSNQFPAGAGTGSATMTVTATGVWPQTVQYGNVYKILINALEPSTREAGKVDAQAWSADWFAIQP